MFCPNVVINSEAQRRQQGTNKETERERRKRGRGRQTKCKETMCSAKQQHNKGNECGCLARMAATRQAEKDRERKGERKAT